MWMTFTFNMCKFEQFFSQSKKFIWIYLKKKLKSMLRAIFPFIYLPFISIVNVINNYSLQS